MAIKPFKRWVFFSIFILRYKGKYTKRKTIIRNGKDHDLKILKPLR